MEKWQCTKCEYIYDPEEGDFENDIEPGTLFEDLPDEWVCPDCGARKNQFTPYEGEEVDDFRYEESDEEPEDENS
jgi:rubredoxin